MTSGSGRVFPRTIKGIERAMLWVSQYRNTVTLFGVSTITVVREA